MKMKEIFKEDAAIQDSYYRNWLNRIVVDGEFPASFKFFSDGKSTNNLNLNKTSATVLMKWLKENFKKLPD